jgi:HPt (histidine-containing phosphotransfer) domain-containing protein
MSIPLIDFDFLRELASNDKTYIYEVIKLYLDTMPSGLEKLEQSIRKASEFEVIQKQAHFLKSSASVVKVRDIYDNLIEIEILARQHSGRDEMNARLDKILANFKEAHPLIIAERDRCKPVKKKAAKK